METLEILVRVFGMFPLLPAVLTIIAVKSVWIRCLAIRGWPLRLACMGAGLLWPVALYLQELAFMRCNPEELSCGGEVGGVIVWLAVWGNSLFGLVAGWLLGRSSAKATSARK